MPTKAETIAKRKSRATKDITVIPGESKEQKLFRLTNKRMEKAVKAISLLGNLAAYGPTSTDVDKMMEHLGSVCGGVEARLRGSKTAIQPFSLREVPPPGKTAIQ